jgi:hypothetical protein
LEAIREKPFRQIPEQAGTRAEAGLAVEVENVVEGGNWAGVFFRLFDLKGLGVVGVRQHEKALLGFTVDEDAVFVEVYCHYGRT